MARLACNLARLRRERGFSSIEALARAADVSRTQLYLIVGNRCDPSIDRLADLGRALTAHPAELLRETDARFSGILNTPPSESIHAPSSPAAMGSGRRSEVRA